MKTVNKLLRSLPLVASFLLVNASFGQFTTFFTETMGTTTSTTVISTYEAANGFDNDSPETMTGNADVRGTTPSVGYSGSSAGANIFFTSASHSFQIEGINTSAYKTIHLSFGIFKSTNASDGSEFVTEVSTDGVTYTALTMETLPFGSQPAGTSSWRKVTLRGHIPSTSNLRIRWRTTGSVAQYRLDDVVLTGAHCNADVTPSIFTSVCEGGSVTLTANADTTIGGADSAYLWSTGENTKSISVSTTGNYFVTVTDTNNCFSTSDFVHVQVNLDPAFAVTISDDTICPGDTVHMHARLLADDLIISEYVEGATGNEKYVEIFNGTGSTVNLNRYYYYAYQNGASSPSAKFHLTGSLADGAVLVLKNPGATSYLGTATSTSAVQHNGNDALAIYDTVSNQFVDILGVIGQDPVSQWCATGGNGTADQTLRRKDFAIFGITTSPTTAGPFGFATLGTEWSNSVTPNDVSGLGSHSFSCSYTWAPSTTPSSGCNVNATPSTTQTYTVTATYGDGCSATNLITVNVFESCEKSMSAHAPNANTVAENKVSVYPNPISDVATINLTLAADNDAVLVDIYDMSGRPVVNLYKGQMNAGEYRLTWDAASGVAPGVYICRVMIGNEMKAIRLLVK